MTRGAVKNVSASVAARLKDLSKRRGDELQLVLGRYAAERFLYRLSVSEFAPDFVLKGAMLFQLWFGEPHRATRDLDLLGSGESTPAAVAAVVRAVIGTDVPDDGLAFDPETVTAGPIREGAAFEGVRVTCLARLGQARIPLQVDVGFGDAVSPGPAEVEYPTLLDFPAPVLAAYPKEVVVAEKFHAMVALGFGNSRMKDFFDVWVLARDFPFDGAEVARAIAATFGLRKTAVPAGPPLALTPAFGADPAKVRQWEAFVRKGRLSAGGVSLGEVCAALGTFLTPPAQAIAADNRFTATWPPGGPWRPS